MFKQWRKRRLLRKMAFHDGAIEAIIDNRPDFGKVNSAITVTIPIEMVKLQIYHQSRLSLIAHLVEEMEQE